MGCVSPVLGGASRDRSCATQTGLRLLPFTAGEALVSDERTGWDSLGCVPPRAPSALLSLGLRWWLV